jgi:hypothetical protein
MNRGSLMKKFGNYLAVVLLAMAMSVLTLPVLSTSVYAANVDLVLLPASQTVEAGKSFTIDIQVQCNGQVIDGVDAFLDFNPEYLEVQVIEGGGVMDTLLQNQYDNVRGAINYSAGKITLPLPSKTFTLAGITFKTRSINKDISTQINFQMTEPRNTFVDLGGKSVVFNPVGATVNVQNRPVTPTATNTVPVPSNSSPASTATQPVATTPAQGATVTPSNATQSASSPTPTRTTMPATTTAPFQSNPPTTTFSPIQTPGSTTTIPSPLLPLTSPTTGAPNTTASLPQTELTKTTSPIIPPAAPITDSPPSSATNWNLIVGIIGGILVIILVLLVMYEKRLRK